MPTANPNLAPLHALAVRDILFRRYSTKLLTRAEYVRATTLFNSQFNAAADDLARRNVVASWLEDLAALHVG